MTRRRLLAVAIASAVAVTAGVIVIALDRSDKQDVSVAAASAPDCATADAPEFLRRLAFDFAARSDPRPPTAEFVATTRSGAQSVASDPSARVPDDEPAYLVQITGGGFEHPGGQIGGSVGRSPVLSLTVSIADEHVTDAGYTSTPADLSPLGAVRQFSLDPSCAPTGSG